jgi:uncharacterized membrane protein
MYIKLLRIFIGTAIDVGGVVFWMAAAWEMVGYFRCK